MAVSQAIAERHASWRLTSLRPASANSESEASVQSRPYGGSMRIAVVGAGVVGLAVSYELVRHGRDVRCFEAAQPMSARSVGDARIFRLAHATPTLVAAAE